MINRSVTVERGLSVRGKQNQEEDSVDKNKT